MALNKLAFMVDTVGNNTFIRNPALQVTNLVLKAGEPQSFTTPTDTRAVIFSANGEYWVNANGSASIPESSTNNGSELNPMGYQVSADVRLSIIAPTEGTRVSIAVYSA